ncbi:hypothetical protein CFC21_033044 [Triticum aestivum]|uniref:Uncharacterized protein n=3 Tax=Triticinae TaxID=1648030 RepID=A0A3B6DP18_WHEAT|nr:hypothetical protein CFC21_033044 [Triticum aestivum]
MAPGHRGQVACLQTPLMREVDITSLHSAQTSTTPVRRGRRRRCVEVDVIFLPSNRSNDEHQSLSIVMRGNGKRKRKRCCPRDRQSIALLLFTMLHAGGHGRAPDHGYLPADGECGACSPLWYNALLRSASVETRCRCY